MHTIKNLYPDYFQKSKSFLFPLLAIRRNARFIPRQTYIAWQGVYEPQDCKLVVTYEAAPEGSVRGWKAFLNEVIIKHPLFYKLCETQDDAQVVCVFNLMGFHRDVDAFLSGRYSRMSSRAKTRIREYFGIGSPDWAYMETYLTPERHFDHYSTLLNVDRGLLESVGELCEPPDLQRELFSTALGQTLAKAEGIV